jgi:hypothetical protein
MMIFFQLQLAGGDGAISERISSVIVEYLHSDNAGPHTAKMSRDYIGLNRMKKAHHPLFARFGTFGLVPFPFWLRQRKADGISR